MFRFPIILNEFLSGQMTNNIIMQFYYWTNDVFSK